MLTVLPTSGYQLLDWPKSWEDYYQFRDAWGLTDSVAVRALALGWWARQRLGLRLWIISGRRSAAEQTALRQAWVAGDSTLPAAPEGQSMHELGRAFDVGADYSLDSQQWADVGRLGKALGLTWGGDFSVPDPPHFQF